MARDIKLPGSVISPVDLNQVIRELEEADQALQAASLRKGGEAVKLPKAGYLLTDVAELNNVNLLHADDRKALLDELSQLKDKAPVLHMSFNADPSPSFMQKISAWMRDEIHPHTLIRTGLLPSIGAGCVLRTTNQVFDLSLKARFDKSKQLLSDELHRALGAG